MSILLPDLIPGRIYRFEEVAHYIGHQEGTSDYYLIQFRFPFDPITRECDILACRWDTPVDLEYRLFAMQEFELQILERQRVLNDIPEHRHRIEAILAILRQGEPAFPVFIYPNDPQREIREGMHRAVAWLEMGGPFLPAFLPRYRD